MKVTKRMIQDAATKGRMKRDGSRQLGWNARQLAVFGLHYPPPKGWQKQLMRKDITDDQWQLSVSLATYSRVPVRRYFDPSIIRDVQVMPETWMRSSANNDD